LRRAPVAGPRARGRHTEALPDHLIEALPWCPPARGNLGKSDHAFLQFLCGVPARGIRSSSSAGWRSDPPPMQDPHPPPREDPQQAANNPWEFSTTGEATSIARGEPACGSPRG